MMPGLRGTAARPFGSSWARARRQTLDGPLRGAVRGDLGRDGTAPVRAEVDDHPGLPRDHRRDDVAEDVGDPLDVHVDETVELLGGDLPGRRVAVDQGCVVDQQVGRAGCGEEPPGPGFHSVLAHDVHGFEVMRCARAARSTSIAPASRPQPMTVCPSRAKPSARARPRPRVAPVITIRLCDDSTMRLRASPRPPSDHPARDVPDDELLYAASAALGSLEPRSRSTPSARPSRTTTLGCDVMRPGPWGTSARRLITLFPPSSRPSRTTSPRCDGRQPQPWRNSTRPRPVQGAIRRASPRGLERTNRPHPRRRRLEGLW